MKKNTCSECAAFSALTHQCRRHSPVMVPVPQPTGTVEAMGLYPATSKDDWCVEFVPDVSVLQ